MAEVPGFEEDEEEFINLLTQEEKIAAQQPKETHCNTPPPTPYVIEEKT